VTKQEREAEMKTTIVVSIVLAAHVMVLGLVFLLEGCKTHKPEPRKEIAAPVLPLPKAAPPSQAETARKIALPPVKTPAPETTTHVVQKGETLSRIAAKYGVRVSEIVALNGIADPNRLRAGQRLAVPGKGPGGIPQETRNVEAARETPIAPVKARPAPNVETARPEPPKPPAKVEPARKETADAKAGPALEPPVLRVHVVRPDETLMDVALTYYVKIPRIRELNGLSEDAKLVPGQRLKIPMPE
jgi:LysM repeat protein